MDNHKQSIDKPKEIPSFSMYNYNIIIILSSSGTLVVSQTTWCCWSHWCSAMADFHVSPLLHVSRCFLTRVSRRLCVSPTYTLATTLAGDLVDHTCQFLLEDGVLHFGEHAVSGELGPI